MRVTVDTFFEEVDFLDSERHLPGIIKTFLLVHSQITWSRFSQS